MPACGPVAVPGECPRRQCAFVPRRPLPIAQVAYSAAGSASSLPTGLSRRRDDNTWYNSNFLHSSQEKHVQEVLLCSSGEGEGPPLCKVSSQDSLIFE